MSPSVYYPSFINNNLGVQAWVDAFTFSKKEKKEEEEQNKNKTIYDS